MKKENIVAFVGLVMIIVGLWMCEMNMPFGLLTIIFGFVLRLVVQLVMKTEARRSRSEIEGKNDIQV